MKRASPLVPGLHRSSLLKKPEDEMLQECCRKAKSSLLSLVVA